MRSGAAGSIADAPRGAAERRPCRWSILIATLLILGIHGALLGATLGDWRVTLDSGYHVSLARAYAEHGIVPWDRINFGPAGRPNLQAPLMHLAVGAVGRAIGGTGDDYLLANAILALVQWTAAVATAAFFGLLLGGEWAMLIAAALLSGAGFAAGAFAAGIPSGWLFIFTPWAIYFFLERRLVLATVAVSAAIYVHVAGAVTAPLGILIASALRRRWRGLIPVGVATAILTAPYTLHVLRYVGWFSGVRNYSALLFDPLLDVLGLLGLVAVLERPREHAFVLAWAIAPLAWLAADPGRFILQSGLVASVFGGMLVAGWIERRKENRRTIWAAILIAIATLCPFGVPALAAEISWAAGVRYPRAINWTRAKALAGVIRDNGLDGKLVADYQPMLCPTIAVYAPITCEKGHWVEVQPPVDPADDLSATDMVYVLPLESGDPALESMARDRWVRAAGSVDDATVLTLSGRAPLAEASIAAGRAVAVEAAWLSSHAVNNSLSTGDLAALFYPPALSARRRELAEQRERAGRMQLALIVYAAALEPDFPQAASRMRRAARRVGVIASFLGDGLALDFESDAATARLKWRLGLLASAAQSLGRVPPPDAGLERALDETFDVYLMSRGATFFERPPSSYVAWLGTLRQR